MKYYVCHVMSYHVNLCDELIMGTSCMYVCHVYRDTFPLYYVSTGVDL